MPPKSVPIVREVRKKIRKTKPGRPENSNEPPLKTIKTQKYIADDPDCEKMLHIIARSSNYKMLSKVGQGAGNISPGEQRRIQEINKELTERISQIPKFSTNPDYIYFINGEKRNFSVEDGVLIDNTIYHRIHCSEDFPANFQKLYDKVNLLAQELDKEFVDNLACLLKDYCSALINIINEDQIAIRNDEFKSLEQKEAELAFKEEQRYQLMHQILTKIRTEPKEYALLAEWEQLKLVTHAFKLQKAISDLDKRAYEEHKTPSENIRRRHLEDIIKQREDAQKELDDGPLLFLIDSLFRVFDKIVRL